MGRLAQAEREDRILAAEEHVLLIGAGEPRMPCLLRQRQPGVRISVLCRIGSLRLLGDPDDYHQVIAMRTDNAEQEWIAAAARLHAHVPVTRIASFGDRYRAMLVRIGEALGLPVPTAQMAAVLADKALMRRALEDAGVESVRWTMIDSAEALRKWLIEQPGRWTVKPADGEASAGVSAISDPEQAEGAYRRCLESRPPPRRMDRDSPPTVLVEEYLAGRQVSAYFVVEGGDLRVVGVSRKFSDPSTFVELGHVTPADVPIDTRRRIEAHVGRVLCALGIRDAVGFSELVLTATDMKTIETHARLPGDEMPDLLHDLTGISLFECVARQTLGEPVLPWLDGKLAGLPGSVKAIWFGVAPFAGTLVRIDGLDTAAAVHPSVRMKQEIADGAQLTETRDSRSRVLWAKAEGPDSETAIERAYHAVAECSLIISVPPVTGSGIETAI